jgi:4-hydroxy-tetrahydrodipicolinate synthase
LAGVIVPLVTPFNANGTVSIEDVRRLVEHLYGRVHGLLPALSSGEGWMLDDCQWTAMVRATRQAAAGLPVLAGILAADTAAVVATTPFGTAVSQDRIVAHYEAILAATDLPLVIYDEFTLSANRIARDTLHRLCTMPRVAGIKASTGSAHWTRQVVADNPTVPVFEGWEHLLGEVTGIHGCITAVANLEPELCAAQLHAPRADRRCAIEALVRLHDLDGPEWVRSLKVELVRRGVLRSERVLDHAEVTG